MYACAYVSVSVCVYELAGGSRSINFSKISIAKDIFHLPSSFIQYKSNIRDIIRQRSFKHVSKLID